MTYVTRHTKFAAGLHRMMKNLTGIVLYPSSGHIPDANLAETVLCPSIGLAPCATHHTTKHYSIPTYVHTYVHTYIHTYRNVIAA